MKVLKYTTESYGYSDGSKDVSMFLNFEFIDEETPDYFVRRYLGERTIEGKYKGETICKQTFDVYEYGGSTYFYVKGGSLLIVREVKCI